MRRDLSPLQWRILRALAVEDPPWSLTGGGALVGFHLHHRETRALDLFCMRLGIFRKWADFRGTLKTKGSRCTPFKPCLASPG